MEDKELYFAFASNFSERKMKEHGAKFLSRESAVRLRIPLQFQQQLER